MSKKSLKDNETFDETFKNKANMYLFDDAAKQKRPQLFSGVENLRSFELHSGIYEAYDEWGFSLEQLE
ncbi:hypothetical protein ACFFIF_11830 [Vagococcus entomophilus]|uniref:Uncharacterized protein n=1 Tax=Vagococcus entomophilus TaxID=1160095 RepID=A0A430AEW2_9ENTE|nr:hypothetical protein [Vagococcus entomophilus]RSU05974.1 hypothetical protein CBF30_11735 [Vagococcus entomophilus]